MKEEKFNVEETPKQLKNVESRREKMQNFVAGRNIHRNGTQVSQKEARKSKKNSNRDEKMLSK